jgi:outer membrane receptor protein involved in Fe transport
MTLNKTKLLLAFCITSHLAYAQIKIQGVVRDNANQAIPFANILLLNAKDSSLVKGSVSNETGAFIFENSKTGRFLLAASMVGYDKKYSAVFETGQSDTPEFILILKESSKNLNEVSVVAKKPLFEQQIDKLVVNVESSITATGGTVLEVLERSPGITVNRQSNSLAMGGKSGVMVMLNGKLTRLPMDAVIQMLEGMSASTIEKIEIISTPPARYDAEGDAGIINIVTKKNLNYGTNGSISATLGYGWYERPAGVLSLNHRAQKFNIYGDYSFLRNHMWEEYTSGRRIQQSNGLESIDVITNRFIINTIHTAKIGFDYDFTPKTTLSGLVSGFYNNYLLNTPSVSAYSGKNESMTQNLDIFRQNLWENILFNLSLRHQFKNKNELSFDVDHLSYYNENPSNYEVKINDTSNPSTDFQKIRIAKKADVSLWVMKTDFTKPLPKNGKFEFGAKASINDLNNDVLLETFTQNNWVQEPDFTQKYLLSENIEAVYTNLNYPISASTNFQGGLRYEWTQTDIYNNEGTSIVRRRYGNLFPSVFFTHKLSKNHSLNFSYSRRITRPSFRDLAPFLYFTDLNTYYHGNEFLFPTISNAFQAGYTLKNTFVFSLRYSIDNNGIALLPHIDPINNRFYYYPENISNQNTFAFNAGIPVILTKWWQSQNSVSIFWQKSRTTFQEVPVSREAWSPRINSSHTFKLPNKFTAELNLFYMGSSIFGIQKQRARSQISVGLQKILSGNNGTLRLNISDIFWTNKVHWITVVPTINLDEKGGVRLEPRVIRLTYTRSFGNQKVKAAKTRATSSEEERQRM